MENKTVTVNDEKKILLSSEQTDSKGLLHVVGWFGVFISVPFFLCVPLGFTDLVPSMIDVFGLVGLRVPAGITIAGLLTAAIGFHRD